MELPKSYKSLKVWIHAIHISLSGFVFIYSLSVFNPCQLNVAGTLNWGSNTSYFINLFSTLLAIGQAIGCLITAKLIDYYGRRKTMIIQNILFIISSIVLVMPTTACFAIGRFFVGVATGVGATVGPLYVGESTPTEMMPKVGPLLFINSAFGMVVSSAFGMMLPSTNVETDPLSYLWIFMFLFPVLVAGYQLLYFVCFVKHDTAQFYLSKNRSAEAETALRLSYNENSLSQGLRRVNSEIEGKSFNGIQVSFSGMIFSKRFRKMIRTGLLFGFIEQMSGITAIFFYSTSIFYSLGGGLFLARLLTLILSFVNLLSIISSPFILSRFGRKTLLVSCQFAISALLLIMALCSGYIKADPIVAAIFLVLYFVPSGFGITCTGWIYVSEVLNDQIYSFASTFQFTLAVVVSVLFPFAVEYIGINNSFLVFSGSMAILAVFSIFELVETKDKDKERILVEMQVILNRVLPRAEDNDSLRSPNEEEEENSQNVDLESPTKELKLNSTGFNDISHQAD